MHLLFAQRGVAAMPTTMPSSSTALDGDGWTSHAYEFWLSVGFRIIGVMPDAEGVGKPGIHLAKPVNRKVGSVVDV